MVVQSGAITWQKLLTMPAELISHYITMQGKQIGCNSFQTVKGLLSCGLVLAGWEHMIIVKQKF